MAYKMPLGGGIEPNQFGVMDTNPPQQNQSVAHSADELQGRERGEIVCISGYGGVVDCKCLVATIKEYCVDRETVVRESRHQTQRLRVLLVDDQVLFTEALTGVLIEKNIDVVVVSCIEDLFAKLSVDEHAFDLVVVDMSMSSTKALALLACIKATHPTVRTALLTGEARSEVVREAIRSGAIGVITRESSISTLITALRFMAEGEEFVPASVLLPSGTLLADPLDLTAEEQAILKEMAGGSSNRDIANVLRIPEAEIKSKIKSIFRKLGVNSRTRAALEARAKGYL